MIADGIEELSNEGITARGATLVSLGRTGAALLLCLLAVTLPSLPPDGEVLVLIDDTNPDLNAAPFPSLAFISPSLLLNGRLVVSEDRVPSCPESEPVLPSRAPPRA